MGLFFRILGPLEVEGAPHLGGPKPRTLLARLLLEPNRFVPLDALVDAVWDDEPPGRARHALQVYVSSLRRALGADRIRAEAGGYAVDVEADELDLLVFERLTAQARSAAGDARAARDLLAEALALWRGPPLADVAPALEPDRARLDELRLAAIEDRAEADLGLGRHADLVAELEALRAEHPLRERLLRQQMLALYRSGRQADALAVYRRARRALVEELGIEPSASLRELETAILRQDAALALESPGPPRRRLPAPATTLVGRRREVGEIRDAVERGARLVTLTGPGGIGKTRLAIEAASELAERFRDGVTFVSLGALRDHSLVPAEIASALGLESPREPTEAIAEHLHDRNALLVVDNFEQVDEAAPTLAEILQAAGSVTLLVTSRSALRLYGEHEYAVGPLALEDEAVPLFLERARAVGTAPAADDTVYALCRRLDRLPLALELAAARTRDLTPNQMLEGLAPLDVAAEGPRDVPERHRTLRAAIEWSCDLLEGPERDHFARLGVFAGGWTEAAAEAVADAQPAVLRTLVASSLVRERGGRFSMLETIREHALERLGARDDVHARHAAYYTALAVESKEARDGEREPELHDRLELERDNLRAALEWQLDHDAAGAARLVDGAYRFWTMRAHHEEGLRAFERVLAQTELADAERAPLLMYTAAFTYARADYERARELGEESLGLYRVHDDRQGACRALVLLGTIATDRGETAAAIACLEESVAIARELGRDELVVFALSHLLWAVGSTGDRARTAELGAEALELSRRLGSRDQEVSVLSTLGSAALVSGDLAEATRRFCDVLSVAQSLRLPQRVLEGLAGMAVAANALGHTKEAGVFREAAAELAAGRDLRLESPLAELYSKLGGTNGVALALDEAIELALEVGRGITSTGEG